MRRDYAICRSLEQNTFVQEHPRWLGEITAMKAAERKCEIQAVYDSGNLDFRHWLLEQVCCAIAAERE